MGLKWGLFGGAGEEDTFILLVIVQLQNKDHQSVRD